MSGLGASLLLDAIMPAQDAVDALELRYPNLQEIIVANCQNEFEDLESIWNEPTDSEVEVDSVLAHEYLLIVAQRLQDAKHPSERELWTKRYTEASVKVFGRPKIKEVTSIAAIELDFFEMADDMLGSPAPFINPVYEEYQQLASSSSKSIPSLGDRYSKLLRAVRTYYFQKYADVFDVFDDIKEDEKLPPVKVNKYFDRALNVLRRQDPAWDEWITAWHESATLSVNVPEKKINIGLHRTPIHAKDIKGLFAHEVLIHAQRAVNGSKIDDNLEHGLPGYIEAEEGLGVIVESAVNGYVPNKIKDRYVDIALALGVARELPMNRKDLFVVAFCRSVIRNLVDDIVFDVGQLKHDTWTHVNRIYRGTLGNEHIGVFTKDVAYYKGFCKIANFITNEIEQNRPVEVSLNYILQGKFDPLKKHHVNFLKSHSRIL